MSAKSDAAYASAALFLEACESMLDDFREDVRYGSPISLVILDEPEFAANVEHSAQLARELLSHITEPVRQIAARARPLGSPPLSVKGYEQVLSALDATAGIASIFTTSSRARSHRALGRLIETLITFDIASLQIELDRERAQVGSKAAVDSDLHKAEFFSRATGGGLDPNMLAKAVKDGRLSQSEKRGGRWYHSISDVVAVYSQYAKMIERFEK